MTISLYLQLRRKRAPAVVNSGAAAPPQQQGSVLSRTKRAFNSRQHYIETLVVADRSMAEHHGDDLEHYILTIMMVANRVFSHPSLGNAIKISVVKVRCSTKCNSTGACEDIRCGSFR